MMADTSRSGGCNCGRVRFDVRGTPVRTGVCHCLTCRKETGSAFMVFAVFDRGHVAVTGLTADWIATTDRRHFCPSCGSTLFATHDDDSEVEIRLGALDEAPSGLWPEYELWVGRRETWLQAIAATAQHDGNRPQ